MQDKKILNIRPDTSVYGTYRRVSYEPWTALAEFVDNSTQSFYDNEKQLYESGNFDNLSVEIYYREDALNGDYIQIIDNAFGMDYENFQRAIILNKPPRKTTGRNEFGMGLKAAACWFGNIWSVESTQLGDENLYFTEVNVNSLIANKTENIDISVSKVDKKHHYTIITIKDLNKKIKGKRVEKKIRDLLSSIYRIDLRKGKISIFYNGDELKFNDINPYKDDKGVVWKKELKFEIPFVNEKLYVVGFVAIRNPGSVPDAGFSLFRRGRTIVGGPELNYRPSEVFGAANSFAYQRVYGELHMDNWPVTQAKDDFDWSADNLEEKFIDELNAQVKEYISFANALRVREATNTSELIGGLENSFKASGGVFKDVEISQVDDKHFAFSSDEQEINANISEKQEVYIEGDKVGVELADNKMISIKLTHDNTKHEFIVKLNDNPRSAWMNIKRPVDDVTNGECEIHHIDLNSNHAFFFPFINKKDFMYIMIKFAVAIAMSEIASKTRAINGKISPSDIRIEMNKILEELSE